MPNKPIPNCQGKERVIHPPQEQELGTVWKRRTAT